MTEVERPRLKTACAVAYSEAVEQLGACAAEGFENDRRDFDLSESRRSADREVGKGLSTLEIAEILIISLLPPRLLAE